MGRCSAVRVTHAHMTTTALVHRCTNTDDPPTFARALSVLGSSAQRAGALALLLDVDGQVVALAGSTGQIQTWNRISAVKGFQPGISAGRRVLGGSWRLKR